VGRLETVIHPREKDLGGFFVRRLLPYATHRMVGPFIFFDHMGPADFSPGEGINVRPHPHINLATVTFLFEGKIRHRDSLGSDREIEPGAINWMTAGRGIVHSERTPDNVRARGGRMNGIQLWVALPDGKEEFEPTFHHHPKEDLPEFVEQSARLKLLLGSAFGRVSPVVVHSKMFYVEARLRAGTRFVLPADGQECAAYVAAGFARVDGEDIPQFSMAIGKRGEDLVVEAVEESHVMFLGGDPVGPRLIYWNFVSSSAQRLERAKSDWRLGPGATAAFPKVPGDDQEFIPLPND
jgi:redox-sensitive bicupin YhaK (pirin superfamily)